MTRSGSVIEARGISKSYPVGFFRKRELDDRHRRAIPRQARHQCIRIVRKKKITENDAQRAAAERELGFFERG